MLPKKRLPHFYPETGQGGGSPKPGKAAFGGKPGGRRKRISGQFGNLNREHLEAWLPFGLIRIERKEYGFPKGIVRFAKEQPIPTIAGVLGIEAETAEMVKKEAIENEELGRELLVQIVAERDARNFLRTKKTMHKVRKRKSHT